MHQAGTRAVALVVAIIMSITLAACASGGAESAPGDPTATVSGALKVLTPSDRETVTSDTVTFAGTAPQGATVVRDIGLAPDDAVIATDGTWTLVVELDEGENEITLRLGDDDATATTIHITYAPATAEGTAAQESTPEPEPEATAEPEPTSEPTEAPTPKPVKVSYKKLSDRSWRKVVKSPDTYTGKTYLLWACIWQFDAATGDEAFLGYASNKKRAYWYLDGENANFTGPAGRLDDFVEDDLVVMNVTVVGSYSYDTQAGGNTTVPWFDIKKITRKGSCD